jgi:pimeloyl-ACP methyl ester carboxylesterase
MKTRLFFLFLALQGPWLCPEKLVLIHGLGDRYGFFWGLAGPLFTKAGYPTISFTYNREGQGETIPMIARDLGAFLSTNVRKGERATLVCHSMGGLIAEQYLFFGEKKTPVARVITLGTPWHGSRIAELAMATAARLDMDLDRIPFSDLVPALDLRPGSELILSQLKVRQTRGLEVPFEVIQGSGGSLASMKGDWLVTLVEGERASIVHLLETDGSWTRLADLSARNTRTCELPLTHFPVFTTGLHTMWNQGHPTFQLVVSILRNSPIPASPPNGQIALFMKPERMFRWVDPKSVDVAHDFTLSTGGRLVLANTSGDSPLGAVIDGKVFLLARGRYHWFFSREVWDAIDAGRY